MKENNGEHGTNHAYLLWVNGKPSKVSSDRQCLIPHANQALTDGCKADITFHEHYQECFDLVKSGVDFDHWMNDTPSSNRFVKSSFALSLLWVAYFYLEISRSYKRVCGEWYASWRYAKRTSTNYKRSLA